MSEICTIGRKIGSFDISPNSDQVVFDHLKNKKYAFYIFDSKKGREQRLIGDE